MDHVVFDLDNTLIYAEWDGHGDFDITCDMSFRRAANYGIFVREGAAAARGYVYSSNEPAFVAAVVAGLNKLGADLKVLRCDEADGEKTCAGVIAALGVTPSIIIDDCVKNYSDALSYNIVIDYVIPYYGPH